MGPVDALLLDDDELGRETMELLLQKLGYRVVAVATTAEALGVLYTRKPSIIIADWYLGNTTALTVLETAGVVSPDCRRIVLSGVSRQDAGYDGDEFDVWLVKPIALAPLQAALGKQR